MSLFLFMEHQLLLQFSQKTGENWASIEAIAQGNDNIDTQEAVRRAMQPGNLAKLQEAAPAAHADLANTLKAAEQSLLPAILLPSLSGPLRRALAVALTFAQVFLPQRLPVYRKALEDSVDSLEAVLAKQDIDNQLATLEQVIQQLIGGDIDWSPLFDPEVSENHRALQEVEQKLRQSAWQLGCWLTAETSAPNDVEREQIFASLAQLTEMAAMLRAMNGPEGVAHNPQETQGLLERGRETIALIDQYLSEVSR